MKPSKLKFHFRNTFNKLHAIVANVILIAVIQQFFFSDQAWEYGDGFWFAASLVLTIVPQILLIRETLQQYKIQYPN
jgi:nicotinamide riboside transporter PnuC